MDWRELLFYQRRLGLFCHRWRQVRITFFFLTGSRPVFSLNDFILSGLYSVFVTKVIFLHHSLPLLHAVVTLVSGWMRICTWAAAAPATPSITVASQKPTISGSWNWRCGRSVEETYSQTRLAPSLPPPPTHPQLICFIKMAFIAEQKRLQKLIHPVWTSNPPTAGSLCVIWIVSWNKAKKADLEQCPRVKVGMQTVPWWAHSCGFGSLTEVTGALCCETGFLESSFLNGVGLKSQTALIVHVNQFTPW